MLFAYPTFLFALFALLIPVVIHLFQLRKYQKIVFSDIRFLKQIVTQNQKQRNIKEWIILLTRCLALACLVFAFAKPFIPFGNKNRLNTDKAISIFIDNSLSMSQQNNEGQLLEVAKNKAKEIVSFYGDNDLFQLLTNDFEGKHQHFINKKEVLLYIDEVKLSNQSKEFSKIILRQKQLFENTVIANKISYVISDFQKNQFHNLQQIDSNIQFNFVPIKANQNNNIGIDSAWIEQPLILPNVPTNLQVKISNFGNIDIENVPLVFKIDGIQKGIANISCKANSNTQIELQFTLKDLEFHEAELSILDNPVLFDDKLFLTLKAYGNQQVICINDNTTIKNVFDVDANFKLISYNENNIDYSNFSNASCIIINEPTSFSTGLQNELQKYISNGGVVLIIPNASGNDLIKTNAFLQQINAPILAPATSQNLKIERINLFDDVFKNVFNKIPKLANWPAISKYYTMNINSTIKGYNIATLNNDAAYIFKSKYGKGVVYLLSTPLKTDWSNFTEHALFVPFILRLPLVNKQSGALYYNLDKTVNYVFDKNTNSKVVYLKNKNEEIAFDISNTESKSSINIDGIKQPTSYQILEQNKTNKLSKIAFNLNRSESNLQYVSNDSLNTPNTHIIKANELLKHQKQIELNFNGTQLWRWFLLAAFVFILIEILLLKWK